MKSEFPLHISPFATLYFWGGSDAELRAAIGKLFHDFRQRHGDALTHIQHPSTGKYLPLSRSRLNEISWLAKQPALKGWDLTIQSGDYNQVADRGMIAMGVPGWSGGLGFVTWWSPAIEPLREDLFTACECIKPVHGYGGLGLVLPRDHGLVQRHAATIYAMAMQWPGLEIDLPAQQSVRLGDGIKGINWLTVLDYDLVEQISHQPLSDEVTRFEWSHGVLLQAGAQPELEASRAYYEAWRWVRPLVADLNFPLLVEREGCFSRSETHAWQYRFDSKN